MITGQLKSEIESLWLEFHQGGITNPLTVIEQITYLMFMRLHDVNEKRDENRMQRSGEEYKRRFSDDEQDCRWSHFRHLGGKEMLPLVRDEVFKHLRDSSEFMKDAQLMIQKESLLVKAVNMIDKLPLTEGDTKGDLYEYLLGKLTTAGINGQFRTPRHIIRLMVDMLEPEPTDTIADPSAGTGGFLVQVMEFMLEKYTSPEGIIEEIDSDSGESIKLYTGDLLEEHREHVQSGMFHGYDFDSTMLRIAAMNLTLHGVDNPEIHYQDTLSNSFIERFPRAASESFDIVLANPPFKGALDYEDVDAGLLRQVKTKKTELLFLVLILRMLKFGGRSATIVPDGVLFGSSGAHLKLRKMLVDNNQLEAVISLPTGVFKPYAGVSTGILLFTKGGETRDVFFYEVLADGLSLDDKRDPVDDNDLPDCLARWRARDPKKDVDRRDKSFFVSVEDIRESNYDLSLNRYKERVYKDEKHDPPLVILEQMKSLNVEIASELAELEEMLG